VAAGVGDDILARFDNGYGGARHCGTFGQRVRNSADDVASKDRDGREPECERGSKAAVN
jgi:hypothetical protein